MVRTVSRIGLGMVVLVSLVVLTGCQGERESSSPGKKVVLWNGDFTGWERFVAEDNIDVNDVWRARGDVLYCSGKPNGYIRTANSHQDYQLHVEWRWPETPTNSGVLLHAEGPDQVWPKCVECQLKAGGAGDFVLMGGAGLTVDGVDRQNPARRFVVIEKKAPMSENPAGQWNSYDIICEGGSIRCFVNGTLQNEGTNARPGSGWICLQSEGGPIEFRNIYLMPVE